MFGEGSSQGLMLMAAKQLFVVIQQQAARKEMRSYKVDVQFIEV
jgi:hypothetical protein